MTGVSSLPFCEQIVVLHSRIVQCGASLIAIGVAMISQTANADTRVFAEVSTKTESAENPYLLPDTNTQAVSISASVAPSLIINDGTSEFRLNAKLGLTEFLRRYDSNQNYGINGSVTHRLNSRFSVDAGLSFDSGVIGAGDLQTVRQTDPVAAPPPPTATGDVPLSTLGGRRNSIAGTVNANFRATSRDSWQIGGNFAFSRFPSGLVTSEYDQSGVSFGFNRTLSDRTSIGINTSVSRTDYRRTRIGDSLTGSPQITVSTQLGLLWSLSGSVGLTVSSSRTPIGSITQTSFSGSANLCRSGDRNRLCAFLSRAVQPTLGGNVRPQTTLGGSYQRQLSEKGSVTADVGFTGASSGGVGTQRGTQFARASATYTYRFTDKFAATVSGGYNDSFRDLVQRRANYSVGVGLTYLLGKRR